MLGMYVNFVKKGIFLLNENIAEWRSCEVRSHFLREGRKMGTDHPSLGGSGAGSFAPILGSGAHHCFNDLITVQGLLNHVDFPALIRVGSLDSLFSDLLEKCVPCKPLNRVGSSDHMAVLTQVILTPAVGEIRKREIWLWGRAK